MSGDMADFALEQVMDEEDMRFMYRTGGMSDVEAYELGIIDEAGAYNHPPMFGSRQHCGGKTCRHCGAAGLHWKQTAHGWRLAGSSGDVHACAQRFSRH